jgi:two-component system OmpR family sensor kinase
MVQAGGTSFWQSVRELPARTPLRVRLITVLLALVAIALLVIGVAGVGFLRSYLDGQANGQLSAIITGAPARDLVRDYVNTGQQQPEPGWTIYWLPGHGRAVQVAQPVQPGYGPSGDGAMAGPRITPGAGWLTSQQPATVAATSGGGHWRVVAYPATIPDFATGQAINGTIVIGTDFTSAYRTLAKLTGVDVIVSGGLLLVLAIVGVGMIRASLRPLNDIEQTAGAIADGDLSRRVPERDPRTEVGRLGRSLNAMLSQIESAFHARSRSEAEARRSEERMRQFVADASHELRTPLTAIRGFAEYYRQRGGVALGGEGTANGGPGRPGQLPPADLDRIMRRVEQEAARMGVLVEDMLLLARLDQQRPLESRPVDLLTLAADAVHDARVVAPSRDINLTVGSGAALLVIGDEVRLRQVIGNLMSNALTHTPDGTAIDVLIRSGNLDEAPAPAPPPPDWPGEPGDGPEPGQDELAGPAPAGNDSGVEYGTDSWNAPVATATGPHPAAVLEVSDHGAGLTKEQADHVFERFYRADQARTSGGTGLGLAIVAALVAAHGGATWVRTRPGQGATFCIALPLSADAVQGSEDDYDADDLSDEADATGEAVSGGNADGPGQAGAAGGDRPHSADMLAETAGAHAPGADDHVRGGSGLTPSGQAAST